MSNLPETYVIFRDVSRTPANDAEFIVRLKRFSRSTLLRVCSALNIVLDQWEEGYDKNSHKKLVHSFFSQQLALQLLAIGRPVFHRHQLLFVAQEGLRHCDDSPQALIGGPDWGGIGILMLMASELLAKPRQTAPSKSEELARKVSSVLPDMETNGPSTYYRKMARSLAMCTRLVHQLRQSKNFFDIGTLFREANGIELETFYALLFGCLSRFVNLKEIKASPHLEEFGIAVSHFKKCTAITSNDLRNFFEITAADADRYAAEVRQRNPHRNEFTVLRNRPLFADNGIYRPLDLSLLADKMETGIFWSVNSQVVAQRREQFHQFWGEVFELYARWLFDSCMDGKVNKFYPDPRYAARPHEQVCDAIVLSNRIAILIEFKGSTFTANGKYGGDPHVFDEELKKKLVGTQQSPKGVRQLVNALKKIWMTDDPAAILGVDMRDIDTVCPVVLTRDDIGSAYNMSAYLNFHFQELVKGSPAIRHVTPLSCLSADDIERLTPYLCDTSLSEIILARIAGDKDLIYPLWYGENTVLGGLTNRPAIFLNSEIEKLIEMCQVRLGLKE